MSWGTNYGNHYGGSLNMLTGKERIPIISGGGLTIALEDSRAASDTVMVPLLNGGPSHRVNDLWRLPGYVRIPLVSGGESVTVLEMQSFQVVTSSAAATMAGHGSSSIVGAAV